jgi:nitrite reductase (NADH) large subunit
MSCADVKKVTFWWPPEACTVAHTLPPRMLIKTNQWEFMHMSKKKLVMVGNGMAGVRTLEELLKIAPEHYEITVFGAEPHPNYNRILLSPVLAGEMTIQDIILNDHAWYAQHGITLHLGKKGEHDRPRAAPGDRRRRHRSDLRPPAAGDRFEPVHPAGPRQRSAGRHFVPRHQRYRRDDRRARRYRHAVVIGGGLLGLEAANGLKLRGMDVTVVHLADWLLERQLDQTAGRMLQKSLEDRGLKFLLGKQTEMLIAGESGRVAAIRLKDGLQIPAELVVMAVGIRPNTALAESAGIYCQRGIVVNDTMQTYDPKVYAVGECVAHRGIAYGLVAPLFEQGKVAANHLANFGISRYTGSVTSTKLKVTGIDLFSAGDFFGGRRPRRSSSTMPPAGSTRSW